MFGSDLVGVAVKALVLVSCLSAGAAGAPVEEVKRMLNTKRASEYPFPDPNYIVNNYMRPDMRAPTLPGVFYNVDPLVLNRTQIQQAAANMGAISLYDVYYPDDNGNAPFSQFGGPYRSYDDQGELRAWFRYTSRVYAQTLRNNVAYLIWDQNRPFQNNGQSWTAIWSSDEFDAILRGQTAIDTVYLVDPVTLQPSATPFWMRGQPVPAGWSIPQPGANSESDDTANPDPSSSSSKRAVVVPAVPPHLSGRLVARAPSIGGIEQDVESIFSPNQIEPWSAGSCSFHFVQTAAALTFSSGSGSYLMNITLYDFQQTNVIGGVNQALIYSGSNYSMPSRLPYSLVMTPDPSDPTQPVQFAYGSMFWSSADSNCATGGYNNAQAPVRNGDCSFDCVSRGPTPLTLGTSELTSLQNQFQ